MHRAAVVFAALSLFTARAEAQAAPTPPSNGTVVPLTQRLDPALLTFTSDKPRTRLERDGGDDWVPVCEAPCRVAVDPLATYRVDGPSMSTSRELRFAPGPAHVHAQPGALSARAGGIVMTSIGGFVALLGPALWSFDNICLEECSKRPKATFAGTALPFLVVGGAAIAGGVALISRGRTVVKVTPDGVTVGRAQLTARGVAF